MPMENPKGSKKTAKPVTWGERTLKNAERVKHRFADPRFPQVIAQFVEMVKAQDAEDRKKAEAAA